MRSKCVGTLSDFLKSLRLIPCCCTLLFLALFSFCLPSWGRVEFKGLLDADIQSLKESYLGIISKKLKPSEVDEIIEFLMKKKNYEKLTALQDTAGTVQFVGQPLKKISKVQINGNKKIDENTLLLALNVKSDERFDSNAVANGIEKIKELYGREGYFNASISFSYSDKEPTQTDLLIAIQEGEPCRIVSFQFESPNKKINQLLTARTKRFKNDIFTEGLLLESEKEMSQFLKSQRYLNAKLEQKNAVYNNEKTRATLVYKVLDTFKYEVRFEGQKHFSSGDLSRHLKLDQFDTGSVDPASDISKAITDKYITAGFAFSKINFRENRSDTDFTRQIQVTIQEGPQVKIAKYDITGRLSRPPEYYSNFIRKNSSDAVEDKLFVRRDIENGIKNLIAQLNNEGFLKAKIQSSRFEFGPDNKSVAAKIVIDEGPLTQVRAILFEGQTQFTTEQLLKVVSLRSNEPLLLSELENSIQNLITFYQDRGFIEMRLQNRDDQFILYDEKGSQANIIFKIYEGPSVRVQNIIIDGNSFTKEYVIRQMLEIREGDLLTLYKLDEAKKRIERSGLFSRVELRTLEENTKVSDRTLVVSVSEQDPGIFRMGFGVNNNRDLTLRGFIGASYNNLYGTGRAVSTRLNLENNIVKTNYNEYEASVSYLEPFIIRSKFRGRANFTRQEKVQEAKYGDRQLEIQQSDKLSFIAERDLTSNIRFSWTAWSFETVRNFIDGKNIDNIQNSEQKIATIGPVMDFDFRDNPLLPTKGIFTRIEADFSDPSLGSSSKINFLRTQATVSNYLRLFSPSWVWANSIRGGYGRNLSDETGSGIPESYSYFLGGFSTLRGYAGSPRDRIPNDIAFPITASDKLIVPKETSFYLVKSEIRFPVYGVIGGVLFTDIGNVRINKSSSAAGYDGPEKQTYGLGIRINTPVGPLSLDYARKKKADKSIDESPDQWHLSIGTF